MYKQNSMTPKKGIPAIPMIKILRQYAVDNNLPFKINNWETIVRLFNRYCTLTSLKN